MRSAPLGLPPLSQVAGGYCGLEENHSSVEEREGS